MNDSTTTTVPCTEGEIHFGFCPTGPIPTIDPVPITEPTCTEGEIHFGFCPTTSTIGTIDGPATVDQPAVRATTTTETSQSAPPPIDTLPATGDPAAAIGLTAVVLVAAGASLMRAARR